MLVRSAGRRQRRYSSQVIAASFAQLNLPWLAPAQLRWTASQLSTASTPLNRAQRHSTPRHRYPQTRNLATPAGQHATSPARFEPPPEYAGAFKNSKQDQNVPWDFARSGGATDPARLPHRNAPLIDTTMEKAPEMIRLAGGVRGSTLELLQHLHTCLRVGRIDRAESIIRRLADKTSPTSPEMQHAHTLFLQEMLNKVNSSLINSEESQATFKEMQKWFEVEVRGKGTQPDSAMLVVMVRASITAAGNSLDRSIKRYADIARSVSEDALDDVLYSEEYDDEEFMILGEAVPEYYDEQDVAAAAVESEITSTEPTQVKLTGTRPTDGLSLDEIPAVLSTSQKGSGLEGVKRALTVLIESSKTPANETPEGYETRQYERQRLMEETAVDIAVEQWREADEELKKIGIHTAMQSRPVGALMWHWLQELVPALRKELASVKKALKNSDTSEHDRILYGPYLESVPAEKIAAITILTVMSATGSHKARKPSPLELQQAAGEHARQDVKLAALTMSIGKAIQQESSILASKSKGNKKAYTGRQTRGMRRKAAKKSSEPGPQREKTGTSDVKDVQNSDWPTQVMVKLGAMLISKLVETARLPVTRMHPRTKEKMTQLQPAFTHRVKYVGGKKVGTIMPHSTLIEKLESEPLPGMMAKRMPMIVKPKPWTGWNEGGYLKYSTPILRLGAGDRSGKTYFEAANREGGLDQVYKGLNALSQVPWKINQDVFKVQLEAWNTGEEIANFAPLKPALELPPEPEAAADPSDRRRWLGLMREVENKRTGLHSKRCFQNFQLEIARAVVNETLYFPHNLDFRGRAYPIPPYLNHMGADNVRSLVTFAEGKTLGEDGLRWLKIHLATVAGYDKASLEERLLFVDENLENIYDSVRNPLGGKRWWLKSEDAWQTIAACFELTKALDSPDPTKYVSHLPVHQDGTCNGLQHYAALGGDEIGARQVNLEPGDRPADVYTAVADAVKEEVRKDAEAGNIIAQTLHGRLTRKCVKQPVMTNVYGVTFFGAKAQVRKQLEVLFPEIGSYSEPNLGQMSHYVTRKIFQSLGTMFGGAQAIQTWLGQCADRISSCLTPAQIKFLIASEEPKQVETVDAKSKKPATKQKPKSTKLKKAMSKDDKLKAMFKSTVVWTTPLSLPVVQPYRKSKSQVISTSIQALSFQDPQVWDPVSKRKQLQAFPPNFIHSLDATHMLLSATKCTENGLTFASIHDSFWTHACDVDRMSSMLRDAFVDMHSDDIVGRLREEFQARYKGCMQLAAVNATSEVGRKIVALRSGNPAGVSHTPKSGELAQEMERLRLLESENPEEKAAGEAMVTPGSIFASEGDQSAVVVPAEISSQKLGEIPDTAEEHATNTECDDAITPEELETEFNAYTGLDLVVKKKAVEKKIHVWLPISFPEVPRKGSFDVRRLKDSKYFFH
ncbi:Hypothetical protein R9X50_00752400 [Acrodontium crateriforme]|uniref:DNA-directed RNA polymerase n=1 Tax=Acrodontium crateriforme TaxID=150365 RepID=A0AAQ3MCZ7_9PEZI|nr:Hypothetical protein R9X50_00752400 [Acrodontium crateriforme]